MTSGENQKRATELAHLASALSDNSDRWKKICVEELKMTVKYSVIELNQCIKGLGFRDYELDFLKGRIPLGHARMQFPRNAAGIPSPAKKA